MEPQSVCGLGLLKIGRERFQPTLRTAFSLSERPRSPRCPPRRWLSEAFSALGHPQTFPSSPPPFETRSLAAAVIETPPHTALQHEVIRFRLVHPRSSRLGRSILDHECE